MSKKYKISERELYNLLHPDVPGEQAVEGSGSPEQLDEQLGALGQGVKAGAGKVGSFLKGLFKGTDDAAKATQTATAGRSASAVVTTGGKFGTAKIRDAFRVYSIFEKKNLLTAIFLTLRLSFNALIKKIEQKKVF